MRSWIRSPSGKNASAFIGCTANRADETSTPVRATLYNSLLIVKGVYCLVRGVYIHGWIRLLLSTGLICGRRTPRADVPCGGHDRHVVMGCFVLCCVVLCCVVLCCVMLCCDVLYRVVLCCVVSCCVVFRRVVLCCVVLCASSFCGVRKKRHFSTDVYCTAPTRYIQNRSSSDLISRTKHRHV